MSAFQTYRPLVVDANQCKSETTIAADNGFRHVKRGEWIIRGENGECYMVDHQFFQRTFAPLEGAVVCGQAAEGRHYGVSFFFLVETRVLRCAQDDKWLPES